jgi:hypothetical protein
MSDHERSVGNPHHGALRRGGFVGWFLILLGVVLLVINLFELTGSWILLAIGGAFLAWYLDSRNYGLLIPACILLGLGLASILEGVRPWYFDVEWTLLWIGLAFVAIYLVDRFTWHQSSTWPLWPGGILILISVWQTRWFSNLFDWLWWGVLADWWPVLIILLGIWLLRRRRAPAPFPGPPERPPVEPPAA